MKWAIYKTGRREEMIERRGVYDVFKWSKLFLGCGISTIIGYM